MFWSDVIVCSFYACRYPICVGFLESFVLVKRHKDSSMYQRNAHTAKDQGFNTHPHTRKKQLKKILSSTVHTHTCTYRDLVGRRLTPCKSLPVQCSRLKRSRGFSFVAFDWSCTHTHTLKREGRGILIKRCKSCLLSSGLCLCFFNAYVQVHSACVCVLNLMTFHTTKLITKLLLRSICCV